MRDTPTSPSTIPRSNSYSFENPSATASLNHLGVEVADTSLVKEAADRFTLEQMETVSEEAVDCCFAVQDKVWVTSPEGEQWEVYTVLDDDGTVGRHIRLGDDVGLLHDVRTVELRLLLNRISFGDAVRNQRLDTVEHSATFSL